MHASSFCRIAQGMSHAARGNRSSPPIPLFEGALTAIQHNAKKLCATAAGCLSMSVQPLRIISAILNGRQPFGLSRCGASRHVVRSPPSRSAPGGCGPRCGPPLRPSAVRLPARRERERRREEVPSFEVVVLACPGRPSTVLGGSRAASLEPLTHLRAVLGRRGKQPQQEPSP